LVFIAIYLLVMFSDRTKSATHFCNDFFNCAQEEKSDDQKQNVNEITRTFGYIV